MGAFRLEMDRVNWVMLLYVGAGGGDGSGCQMMSQWG